MTKRSKWKGPFVDPRLLKKCHKAMQAPKGITSVVIKTYSRASTIIPQFINCTFSVYNGKKFIPVRVTEDMVGRKFGEFAPTRTFPGHSGNKKTAGKK